MCLCVYNTRTVHSSYLLEGSLGFPGDGMSLSLGILDPDGMCWAVVKVLFTDTVAINISQRGATGTHIQLHTLTTICEQNPLL